MSGRRFSMRIRPFFWILLVFVCIGTLTLAATVHVPLPAQLHVQLAQHPTPQTPTTFLVHVTDPQGLAVDGAPIFSQAGVTNMDMGKGTNSTVAEGEGTYLVGDCPDMGRAWMVCGFLHAGWVLPR